jgi:NtrC-family two-component system sensor histidine kinase KinB
MKKLSLPLFPKFFLCLASLTAIPLLFVGMQMVNLNREMVNTLIADSQIKLVNDIAKSIDEMLLNIESKIYFIIYTLENPAITLENRDIILSSFLDANPDIMSLSLVNLNGDEVVKLYNPEYKSGAVIKNISNTELFKIVKSTKRRAISNVHYEDDKLLPLIDILYPAKNKYYIYIIFSLKSLWEKILATRIMKTGFVFVIDKNGRALLHPDKDKMLNLASLSHLPIVKSALLELPDKNAKIERISASSIARRYRDEHGKKIIGSYTFSPLLGWGVIVQQDEAEAYSSVNKLRRISYALLGIFCILSAIVSFFLARGLSKPMLELSGAAEKVAEGTFDVQVRIKTGDELENLANTFNKMVSKLKEYADIQLDKLIAEKTKTETIIFSISDGILLTDYNGDILLINNQAKRIFQTLQEKGEEAKNLYSLLPMVRGDLEKIISGEEKTISTEIELQTSSGEANYYQLTSLELITQKGDKLGILTVLHDITLQKQIDKMKDNFVHSITHDLRNPVSSIRGFVKFLQDGVGGPITEQQRHMLNVIDRASFRLLNMINDILDVARIEAGKMIINLEECNINTILSRVEELEAPLAERKNIALLFFHPENTINITADGNLLERVLINLVGNAIKFTPEGGKVEVGVEDLEDRVLFYVKDTGEGIPPEYLDKIFDKFQQLHSTQSRSGTGLGLTICKYVVEAHLGKIYVESKLKVGSKFSFYIPKGLAHDDANNIIIQKGEMLEKIA